MVNLDIRFDLHVHPSSKSFLTNEDRADKKSPWKKVKVGPWGVLAPILKSQSNFSKFFKGNVRLAVFPIVPIEKGFSNYWLIRDIINIFSALNKKFLKNINDGVYSYNELFWDEWEHLNSKLIKGEKRVKILTCIEDFNPDESIINGIISIEGSHAITGSTGQGNIMLKNLTEIKKFPDFTILYLTLTHLTWNYICNHSYGAKITKSVVFRPLENQKGISKDGIDIINLCYNTSAGKRILVDIKHMSAYARFQFYQHRKNNGFSDIPIVATHMGLAGFNVKEIEKHIEVVQDQTPYKVVVYKEICGIKGKKQDEETNFNPWSINLFDEEIKIILDSDGLIGLSLDQRILGFGKTKLEFFQADEFNELLKGPFNIEKVKSSNPVKYASTPEDLDLIQSLMDEPEEFDDETFSDENKAFLEEKQLRHLCNTILHAASVGGKKTWKHLCIGSDFDGLIKPINSCKSIKDYPKLEKDLINELPAMAKIGQNNNPGLNYHIEDIRTQVRDIMYNNGKQFLDKYFTKQYLNSGKI
ncbi:Membrane dipeptidase (Peptidase family M19) [Cyclobacterium lianum]|uniref:Membrane dipeptidase (Peptidase family M19) n=1 Tax=Cyclobacterium lianum TaxID=388280 RepID=A0A1M7PZR4_9BACT|nr:membrane dipeptidase [Cyclobacterium lianum]SHN23281.1 Membrane dipeptidase (Peptidase family M19) [Cyclobacterium lianum]